MQFASDLSCNVKTPLGTLHLVSDGQSIIKLGWYEIEANGTSEVLKEAAQQLSDYFDGNLHQFSLPLNPAGGEFQQQVHDAMSAIPYGETRTYGDLAGALDSAAQPVGNACGKNPIPIIIPCHRVLAAHNLGGFSGDGGVETKLWLLRHENAVPYLI